MTLSVEQLTSIWREGARVAVPFFDGREVELFFEDEKELRDFGETIRDFLAIGSEARAAATRHVYAYFKDFTDEVGFEWADPRMDKITAESDIWKFVYPTTIGAQESWDVGDKEKKRKFVVLEGNCGWDAEHGILMSWRDGVELVKVSNYDGHATNGHAYADLSKDAYIYFSMHPERCTRPQSGAND